MSLILKGIDLPDNDRYTTLRIYKNGHIWLGKTLVGVAIQIPKGHGRLIDEREVKKMSHDVILGNGAKHRCIDATRMYEAPTILESEVMPNE